MFKKIHSDRDPRDTVLSEIRKEFSPYFHKAGRGLKSAAERYPKFLFWVMVIIISLSAILCFTVFRNREVQKPIKITTPISNGFDQITKVATAIHQTIHLKKIVDSLTKKKTLNKADSATLLKDLDSLNHIKP